ncbi:MAG TPA: MFS transporter [Tepidisphaeraceae bacterium]|jgi:FSR family fosmidomycin resistance protein-like MFS transporter|nr:MFS transporter [Tepidisphaeraceae bacterium]
MSQIPEDVVPAAGENELVQRTALGVLFTLSFSHLLNDTMQSLIPAMYPVMKQSFDLTFTQIGLITLTYQMTASLLQPLVGFYTDRHPKPYSLSVGMAFTLLGLVWLSRAGNLTELLCSAALVGAGSSVFHPEASRVAHMAAGGKHGFAQSLFQVGGNTGSSLGPLLAAWIIVPHGQKSLAWFSLLALLGIVVLAQVGGWYARNRHQMKPKAKPVHSSGEALPRGRVRISLAILMLLIVSKYFYLISLTNYYTFYLIHHFDVSVRASQVYLFVFLFAVAAGTILGGPLGDRFGRKIVIWVSILGVAPFTILLPHVGLTGTAILTVVIGLVLASAFSAILVFAQDLMPGNVGMVAGLFFGFAFGVSGVASAALGKLADMTSIEFVFNVCGYLPLLGLFAAFLPNLGKHPRAK